MDQLGVDYDFSGYRGICSALAPTKRPTHVVFTEEDDEDMKEEEEEEGGRRVGVRGSKRQRANNNPCVSNCVCVLSTSIINSIMRNNN